MEHRRRCFCVHLPSRIPRASIRCSSTSTLLLQRSLELLRTLPLLRICGHALPHQPFRRPRANRTTVSVPPNVSNPAPRDRLTARIANDDSRCSIHPLRYWRHAHLDVPLRRRRHASLFQRQIRRKLEQRRQFLEFRQLFPPSLPSSNWRGLAPIHVRLTN